MLTHTRDCIGDWFVKIPKYIKIEVATSKHVFGYSDPKIFEIM